MTLLQLEYIMEIYHCGSMNKASQRLFVSQSTISTAIKDLEEELGITIFVRGNRGISLTEEGQEFIAKIHPIFEQSKEVIRHYSHHNGEEGCRLFICTQRYPFCAKAFVEFLKKQKDMFFRYGFKECPMGKVIEEVHNGKSDLGIIFLSDDTEIFLNKLFISKNLEFHEMKRIKPHIFMNRNHPLAIKKEIPLSMLQEYPFVVFTKKEESSLSFSEEAVLNQFMDYRQVIYVNDRATFYNITAHTEAVSIGSGVLPEGYCDPRVCAIPIADAVEDMRIGWIKKKENSLSVKAKEFVEILEEQIKKY